MTTTMQRSFLLSTLPAALAVFASGCAGLPAARMALPHTLTTDAATPGATGSGRVQFGAVVLQLQSVHGVQGSPLPLEAPIGHVLTQDGRPVGAVEINGTPRLWHPPAGTPAHDAVTHAALALALLWHPDGG